MLSWFPDKHLGRVDVFQSRLLRNIAKTLGDTQLKEFVGTLTQFHDPVSIENIENNTSNKELASLLRTERVADKVRQGYEVKGVFVTNVSKDTNAEQYLKTHTDLVVYDELALQQSYVPEGNTGPINDTLTFDVYDFDCSQYSIGSDSKVVVAPLAA
jgi:hypothetical protein